MNKLRTQAGLAVSIFLVCILGGACLIYILFAEDFYITKKKSLMDNTSVMK